MTMGIFGPFSLRQLWPKFGDPLRVMGHGVCSKLEGMFFHRENYRENIWQNNGNMGNPWEFSGNSQWIRLRENLKTGCSIDFPMNLLVLSGFNIPLNQSIDKWIFITGET